MATVPELAASIAHELNKPLATVSLGLESLLAQTPEGDPKRGALEAIQVEVERMRKLVSDLLHGSRREHPYVSTLDIRKVIEQVVELAHHHLLKRGISVVQEFAPDLPLTQGDRQELEQVFLILFSTASDAMPDGGTLTLRAFVERRSGEPENPGQGETESERIGEVRLVIEVADTGIAITPENLPKVMEPRLTPKPLGTWAGLGLSICQRIIEDHYGQIAITSEGGRGTTFHITVPVVSGLDQMNRHTA
jgi:signal transduction histidine kinase